MTKSSTNGDNSRATETETTSDGSNPKGDWFNLFFLTVLYTMQGIPYGLSAGLPLIMQSNKTVTYEDQGSLSLALWPSSMKLLWAPVVDLLYIPWMGRRKTWVICCQLVMGILFFCFAYNADDWLPESRRPNIAMITGTLLIINVMSATQDVSVDGWALTMLKKNNVSYASMCDVSGFGVGKFVGFVVPILLTSEDISNRFFRLSPSPGGMISVKGFLVFCGILFTCTPILIGIFKKEKDVSLDNHHVNASIFQSYKILWDILKITHIRVLFIAMLTSLIGFSTSENVAELKLIDAGISKDYISIIHIAMLIGRIFMSFVVARYFDLSKSLSLLLKLVPIRLFWAFAYVGLIYYTPILVKETGTENIPKYYYLIIGSTILINYMMSSTTLIFATSFFNQISDPRYGGTYMTLMNTARNLGNSLSNTIVILMVNKLTFETCSDGSQNNCFTTESKTTCSTNGGYCVTLVNGYYVEVFICLVVGFVWYMIFKKHFKCFKSLKPSDWSVKSS